MEDGSIGQIGFQLIAEDRHVREAVENSDEQVRALELAKENASETQRYFNLKQASFVATSQAKIFDELSERMWTNNAFMNAYLNWNFAPGYLYELTSQVGYERALEEIKATGRKRGIANRGLYLRRRLLNLIPVEERA